MKLTKEPMMSKAEIVIVDNLLKELKPTYCLEWGSGGSTLYYSRLAKHWLSVEHNGNYVKALAPDLPSNVTLIWAPEDEWYEDCVKHSRIFDFILIDGLHRERCLEIALDIISDNGIILLHDSGRAEYQDFIKKNKGEKLIDGEEPYQGYFKHRGLTLFVKEKNLGTS